MISVYIIFFNSQPSIFGSLAFLLSESYPIHLCSQRNSINFTAEIRLNTDRSTVYEHHSNSPLNC